MYIARVQTPPVFLGCKLLEKLKDLEIMTHKLTIDGITVYQDFNCRFTAEGYLLIVIVAAPKGCWVQWSP